MYLQILERVHVRAVSIRSLMYFIAMHRSKGMRYLYSIDKHWFELPKLENDRPFIMQIGLL